MNQTQPVPNEHRPILLSIVQYTDAMESGKITAFDLVDKAKSLGADGLELRRELWPQMAVELPAVRDRIRDLNLRVTFATHSVLFCDPSDRNQLMADVDTAADIGSPLLRIFPGPVPEDAGDPAWNWAKQVVAHAEARGIVIALENYSGSPGGTLAEVRSVLDTLDRPSLMTNIDTGNYAGWKQDILEAIDAMASRVTYVHIKDPGVEEPGTMCPGEGNLPLEEIFAALDALPQRIIYCFEFPGGEDPDDRIWRSLAWMRNR